MIRYSIMRTSPSIQLICQLSSSAISRRGTHLDLPSASVWLTIKTERKSTIDSYGSKSNLYGVS